jgi:hypothetical protein
MVGNWVKATRLRLAMIRMKWEIACLPLILELVKLQFSWLQVPVTPVLYLMTKLPNAGATVLMDNWVKATRLALVMARMKWETTCRLSTLEQFLGRTAKLGKKSLQMALRQRIVSAMLAPQENFLRPRMCHLALTA